MTIGPGDRRPGWTAVGEAFGELDRILRGEATRPPSLERGTVEVNAGRLSAVIIALAMIYGLCMGTFALFSAKGPTAMQMLASMVKVPALFFLTLLVTLPSLYVFNALVGSRLSLGAVVRLLIATLAILTAVLASLGPIVAFFSVSSTSYPFVLLMNVAVFGLSGTLGLLFLLRTLHRLSLGWPTPPASSVRSFPPPGPEEGFPVASAPGEPSPGALERLDDRALSRHVTAIFRVWVVLFGVVGAQMGWVLRPFVGNPELAFSWFRGRESNFFQAVFRTIGNLFS
jgi:hypothetical protein